MTPVEPAAFAAQLIARLERLKREQETMNSLEERLQQIQEVSVCRPASFNTDVVYRCSILFLYTDENVLPSWWL